MGLKDEERWSQGKVRFMNSKQTNQIDEPIKTIAKQKLKLKKMFLCVW